jgi:hypothetical protein
MTPKSENGCQEKKLGVLLFSWSAGKNPAHDTQPPEKQHPPMSFYEAHLEHIQSIFEGLKI